MEAEKKKVKKKAVAETKVGKPKGVGYGDVSNTNLVIEKNTVPEKKKNEDTYSSNKIYQSLADDYRWSVLKVAIKSFRKYLNQRKVDVVLHSTVKYSILPGLLFSLLKAYAVSELIQSDKVNTYNQLLKLLDLLATKVEFGDLLVDKEYGGLDSDRSIFSNLRKLCEEG